MEILKLTIMKKRWLSETPSFFKKVIKVCLTIGGVGATIIAVGATGGIALPAIVVTAAGYMTAVGAVGATVAKCTTTDYNVANETK